MTRVVIVGEIYNADLYPGGGPVWGGGGGPIDPGYGRPEGPGRPDYIWGQRPPHVGGGPVYPGYPSGQPVPPGGPVDPGWGGGWGSGNYPSTGPVRPYPDHGLPPSEPPAGGNPVPEDVYTPAPIPEELASQYIASVYNPKTMTWTTKSYPPR